LLAVVGCESVPLEQISFATRAVRVLDIMTSLDANAFTANNGMNVIISRLAVQRLVMREDCWLRTKSGVTALGRCQRQLSELMAMLAKVCTSIPPRRRTYEPLAVTPDKNAVSLATHLFAAYKVALEWQPKHCADPAVF
uniref:Ras-GEF domain-containing protein n=1 Tax=Toxocara canis TaxID=6265 RepID=A0A183U3Z5_TOXCA